MRRGNKPSLVQHENVLVGVNLSADFVAEHEIGIAAIRRSFGIPSGEKDWGLKRRQITNLPQSHVFGWTSGYMPNSQGFYLLNTWDEKVPDFSRYSELRSSSDTLVGAWDEKSFAVFSSSTEEIANLKEIYEAFLSGDGAIFFGGGKFLENSGMILAIASRIPKEITQKWYEADREAYEIERDVKKSGIRELLEKAGKRYFALSRAHYQDGQLVFWLNPMEQHKNNFGWFSIEALRQWAENTGPIPKKGQ